MAAMKTSIIHVDAQAPDDCLLMPAALALREGRLVAFPTETVYGLGADALNPAAVASIFTVKGRPGDNPLIVHIARLEDLPPLVSSIPPLAQKLFQAFAPGPLTLVLPKSAAVPDLVTAGLDTVAIRIPAHPVARRLIELAGVPVAAPSANRSGRPSPTQSWHVENDLDGLIPYIVDAGSCEFGLESTVIDATGDEPLILRPGAITEAQIRSVTGAVAGSSGPADPEQAPRSPGMKYRHYAPQARVLIAEGATADERAAQTRTDIATLLAEGRRVGVFGCRQFIQGLQQPWFELIKDTWHLNGQATPGRLSGIATSESPDARAAGRLFFDALRRFDQARVDVIIAEALPGSGLGAAYMNRLRKAAADVPGTGADVCRDE